MAPKPVSPAPISEHPHNGGGRGDEGMRGAQRDEGVTWE